MAISEKLQFEDEMKQQRDATKAYIEVLMKDKKDLEEQINKSNQKKLKPAPKAPPSVPPPSVDQNAKDLQRVLQKLSQREHEHNQHNEEMLKLKQLNERYKNENIALKSKLEEIEKSYRITKDKLDTTQQKIEKANKDTAKFHETQTLLQSITNELTQIREKNKIIEQEKENLRDLCRDKTECVNELTDKLDKANLQNANHKGTIQELSTKLDDMSKKGKIQIDELIASNQELAEKNEQINEQMQKMESDHKEIEDKQKEEIEDRESKIDELTEQLNEIEAKHKEVIAAKNTEIKSVEIDYKIKEKKNNKMIKELQGQLKKQIIKSQELKCKVLKSTDELIDIKQKNEKLNEELKNALDENTVSPTNGHQHLRHDQTVNGKASSFVELEVSKSLAKRLEMKEIKINAFKEQTKYLTESIQQLHIDLDNKKTVIENLTKRIDIGALPTFKSKKKKRNNVEISQLELLMQETTLQNAMLRQDLEKMGRALQESMNHRKQNDSKSQT